MSKVIFRAANDRDGSGKAALRARYMNPDGTFKGGFDGCMRYMQEVEGHDEDSARRICAYIRWRKEGANTANDVSGLSAANEFALDADGRIVIPFGDYPVTAYDATGRPRRVIQRLDAKAANTLLSFFRPLGRGSTVHGQVPVYVGHPDMPQWAARPENQPLDRRAHAWVEDMTVAGNALIITPEWSATGKEILANRHHRWPSPYWDMEIVGEEGGATIARPVHLRSIGLTNQPNIKTSAAVNDDGGEETNHTTKEVQVDKWKQLLVTLLGLNETATDEEVEKRTRDTVAAANEAPGLKQTLQVRTNELANERAAWAGKRAELEAEVRSQRAKRADLAAANAVLEGRITVAQKAEWLTKLTAANDDAPFDELAALKPRADLKTSAATDKLGARKNEAAAGLDRIAAINEAIAAEAAKIPGYDPGRDFTTAYLAAKTKHPALFEPARQAD